MVPGANHNAALGSLCLGTIGGDSRNWDIRRQRARLSSVQTVPNRGKPRTNIYESPLIAFQRLRSPAASRYRVATGLQYRPRITPGPAANPV